MPWKRITAGYTPTTPHPSRKASDNPSAGSSYHKKVRPPQICGGLTYNGHFTLPSERYHFHFISSPHYTRAPSVHQTFPLPSSLFPLTSYFFPLTSSIFHHNRNSATFRPELWHFSPRIMPSSSYHSVRYSRYLMTRHIGIKDVRKQLATICVDRHIFIVAIRIP